MTPEAVGRGESAQGREAFRARRSSPSAAAPRQQRTGDKPICHLRQIQGLL
jgi:hypothetical protein